MLLGNCGLPQLVRVIYLIASVGVEIPKDILWTSKFGCSVMASAKSDSEAEAAGYLEAGMSNPLPAAGSGQCSSRGRLTALMLSSSETHQDFCCRTKLNGHAKKVTACKDTKARFEERFKTGKNRWFFTKLRF
ncbi:hypothetical protein NC651_034825 [Populus alba x Populus x berolinensis]|nr:hypothetical protein NC651_034825 [Populus alba x Populus x berolinensis]